MEGIIKQILVGELVEGFAWQIISNYDVGESGTCCGHVKDLVLPRGVRAYNEGSYNFTVVCLDCILENA